MFYSTFYRIKNHGPLVFIYLWSETDSSVSKFDRVFLYLLHYQKSIKIHSSLGYLKYKSSRFRLEKGYERKQNEHFRFFFRHGLSKCEDKASDFVEKWYVHLGSISFKSNCITSRCCKSISFQTSRTENAKTLQKQKEIIKEHIMPVYTWMSFYRESVCVRHILP